MFVGFEKSRIGKMQPAHFAREWLNIGHLFWPGVVSVSDQNSSVGNTLDCIKRLDTVSSLFPS